LAQALGKRLLPTEIVATIHAAEQTGRLGEVLPQLARRHSQQIMHREHDDALLTTMLYVWAVLAIGLNITGFLMYWIIPKFKDIFLDFGVKLPPFSERFYAVNEWASRYWFLLLPIFSLCALAILVLQRLASGNHWGLQWLARWWPRLETPQLMRELSYAVESEGSLPEQLDLLAERDPLLVNRQRFLRIKEGIESGGALADTLADEHVVSKSEATALRAAEPLRHLPWTFEALARRIDQTRRSRFFWFVRFLEPTLLLFLGALALCFALGMMLPLIELLSQVSLEWE
ncbi:MAG: type II secretion system F family protein, partial [Planctomycetaceae bacterium]|nr:type II secretion system F family protein [Planctomycetaceae bacterium]